MENIKKELKVIGEQGLNNNNLEMASKLTDMYKDLKEAEEGGMYGMKNYGRNMNMYDYNSNYDMNGYGRGTEGRGNINYMYERDYREGRMRDERGRYSKLRDKVDRIYEGVDMYEYGKESYQHGGSHEKVYDGLEKLMYAICILVEHAMEDAHTPQEKEIVRKHIDKLSRI